MNNYTVFHLHSDYTNATTIDSTTQFKDYIDLAIKNGQNSIAFSEHGNIYNWIAKKMYCDKNNIKYIHGIEAYITPELTKERKSYHLGLYAKNLNGVLELNELISTSYNKKDGHFYYVPRISFDEVMATSDNIIITTACLSSFINIGFIDKEFDLLSKFLYWMHKNKHRCFLEVQYHNFEEQKTYNKRLIEYSEYLGIPLIAGTDTHNLNEYNSECRKILRLAKDIHYDHEDDLDLNFKTYDEVKFAFEKQGVLTEHQILEAIENTNVLSSMISDFDFDLSYKYPTLYDNPEETLLNSIYENLSIKLDKKSIQVDRYDEYIDQIQIEYNAFVKQNMCSYIMFIGELCNWCWNNDIVIGFSRGSVAGSLIAYLLNITDVDPLVWNTVFSRFCNEDRVSLSDIDLDFKGDDREKVYEYIINRFGIENTSYIITFNKVAEKGAIDEICRALKYTLEDASYIKEVYENNPSIAIERFPDIFYYFDGIRDTIISKGIHPAGMIASPITLHDNLSIITDGLNNQISSCDMKCVDKLNFVKYDILGLKNVGILKDIHAYLNIPYKKVHEYDWFDLKVWEDMLTSPVGIFQFESQFAFDLLKEFQPQSIRDMSIATAVLRPSGASYRDQIIKRIPHKNPSKEIDELLKDNYGYLVFQEDVISFLTNICDFTQGQGDTARRGIGKKDKETINGIILKIIDGYVNHTQKNYEVGKREVEEFVKIITDAIDYMFGYNHSIGYSLIGYAMAYYRYYHPIEFLTAFFNNAETEEDFISGIHLAKQKNITIEPIRFRFSRGHYFYDKSKNTIYRGISSIKFLNFEKGEQLYELKDNVYEDFIDLYDDIILKTNLNKRDLKILILLDYFKDFGENGTLLDLLNYIDKLYGRKQIRIDKSMDIWHDRHLFMKYSKRTKSLYKDFDSIGFLKELSKMLYRRQINSYDRLLSEQEYCGEPISTFPDISEKVVFVSNVDNKYNVYLELYMLKNGRTFSIKLPKKIFEENPINIGDIIIINTIRTRKKYKKIDNAWVETDIFEYILVSYSLLTDIELLEYS